MRAIIDIHCTYNVYTCTCILHILAFDSYMFVHVHCMSFSASIFPEWVIPGESIQQLWNTLGEPHALPLSTKSSLVPRPFFAGEEKNGLASWYTLLAHARYSHKNLGIRTRLHINATFERNLPLYSRILRHVGRWLGMVNIYGPLSTGR